MCASTTTVGCPGLHHISPQGLLEEMGCQLRELAWPDHWWWRNERRLAGPGEQVSLRTETNRSRLRSAEWHRVECNAVD
jgi:hypothetical protein